VYSFWWDSPAFSKQLNSSSNEDGQPINFGKVLRLRREPSKNRELFFKIKMLTNLSQVANPTRKEE